MDDEQKHIARQALAMDDTVFQFHSIHREMNTEERNLHDKLIAARREAKLSVLPSRAGDFDHPNPMHIIRGQTLREF